MFKESMAQLCTKNYMNKDMDRGFDLLISPVFLHIFWKHTDIDLMLQYHRKLRGRFQASPAKYFGK